MNLRRMPFVGSLPPRSERVIDVVPAVSGDYVPVVFSAHAGDVVILNHAPHSVTLKNHNDYPVAYCLLFAKRETMEVATLPWKAIFQQAKAIGHKVIKALGVGEK